MQKVAEPHPRESLCRLLAYFDLWFLFLGAAQGVVALLGCSSVVQVVLDAV